MRLLSVVALVVAASCGDSSVHHLPDAPPGLDAIFAVDAPPADVALHVTKSGTGTGTITSSPDGIACGATCDATLPPGTKLTLTAVADDSSTFTGWGGACSGTTPTCDVTLADATSVTAAFTLKTFTVTVEKSGAGTGAVTGGAIDCGSTCTATVDYGTQLSLTAAPANLSTFAGWGGACSGTGACSVTVTADSDITANFALNDVTLFVTLGGNGAGKVTSADANINCGTTCQHTYSAGDMTTLTAAASTGSTFTGWSGGGCSGTAPCTLTLTAAATVTATFALQPFALTVAKTGTGGGSVTSTPAGIACGTACTHAYDYGTVVTLAAAASTGSTFTGWSGGGCTGTGACAVTIAQATTVTAGFTLDSETLTVTKTGSGTVTGGGITCGTTCTANLSYGTMVTLTAAAATGSTFAGWGGACTGTGTCMVTMDAAKTVSATFALNNYALTVTKSGTGTGTVNGGMISCGATCSETVPFGTMVTLVATPATGSTFTGWSGACSGTGNCVVTISAATSVDAAFTQQMFPLTVTRSGTGTGTVTGGSINCGTACTQDAPYGTAIALTATPDLGSMFTGWSGGGCTGTGTCTVTITGATAITASFALIPETLSVSLSGTGTGTVTGGSINCGATCSETAGYGTMITLTATPSTADATLSTFTGWTGGGCSGTGTCTVTLTAATTVMASFVLKPNIVFATSTSSTGNLSGLAGADATCRSLAAAAGLSGTYVAYLSINGTSAPSRVGSASGWVRRDGKPVANTISQFSVGTLFNAVALDETGAAVAAPLTVWTGTRSDGTFDTEVCVDPATGNAWAGTSLRTEVGNVTSTTSPGVIDATIFPCTGASRLYCFGTDRKAIAQ